MSRTSRSCITSNQALRAHKLFQRDKDYIVRNDEVVIIDEFTGRMMPGRRYSEGLHQALEAKEHVHPAGERDARLDHLPELLPPLQEARRHDRHGGDRGRRIRRRSTSSKSSRFRPTSPVARDDHDDEVYRTSEERTRAVMREIEEAHAKGQPLLVGTTSIEKSELLAEVMKKHKYQHDRLRRPAQRSSRSMRRRAQGVPSRLFAVLNARFHEQEAYIVAQAGVPGAITIATNMAGRGTDIQLGGNAEMRIRHDLGRHGAFRGAQRQGGRRSAPRSLPSRPR